MGKVTVRLPFFLGRKVGKDEFVVEAASAADAVRRVEAEAGIKLDPTEHLFFVNNRVVDRDGLGSVSVAAGDKLRIVQPLAGG